MRKILVVDDDKHLRTLVRTYAEVDGYQCSEACNGEEALDIITHSPFDMVVLDVMMPGQDGFEILSEIRKITETPVIMLTARKEEYDKLLGFNLGADDYLSKPFSPKELMARIKSILKREKMSGSNILRFGEMEINIDSHTVTLYEKEVSLTKTEFELLVFLAKNNRKVMTRDSILNNVWGYDYFGDMRTVDTHIKSLRTNLGDYREVIKTVWVVGYTFEYKEEK